MTKNKKKASAKKTTKPVKKKPVKKAVKKQTKPAKKKKKEDLMCFLTTACVRYYSLADDGYELNTLRGFRDTYLASTLRGRDLIGEYYKISPALVSLIEKDEEKKDVYAFIHKMVNRACSEIDNGKLSSAQITYVKMVTTLKKKYLN